MASADIQLMLSLQVRKGPYVKAESIPLKVSLMNNTPYDFELADFTGFSDHLHIRMIDKTGKRYSGSLLSSLVREGILMPDLETEFFVLESLSKKTTEIDLIRIFGNLLENIYRVKAFYYSGFLFLDSNVVQVEVVPSRPVYSMCPRDYLRLMNTPQRTSWINQEKDGYYLFLREDSPNLPGNIWANRRLTKLDEAKEVSLAALASDDLEVEHILWLEAGRIIVLVIKRDKLVSVEHVELSLPNLRVLDPPFTDEDGTLFCLVASHMSGTTSLHLLTCSYDGKATTTQISRVVGQLKEYSVLFDELERVHIAYTESNERACFYTKASLYETVETHAEALPVIESKLPIMGVELSRVLEDEEGNLQLCLHFMTKEPEDKIYSRVVNIETGKPIQHSFFTTPKAKELKLLDVVLDFACNPHPLFLDRNGVLWYKPLEDKGLEKATEVGEVFPSDVEFPMLLVSSERSRHYGIYLRYVKDRSRFVYKKLESLE